MATTTTTTRSLRLVRLLTSSTAPLFATASSRQNAGLVSKAYRNHAAAAFSSSSPSAPPSQGGLFGVPHLRHPKDLLAWADSSIRDCQRLAQRIASPTDQSAPNPARVVKLMDALSDKACQAYDLAEAARHVHGDAQWRAAAGAACARLGAYVAAVNHDGSVADALAGAMERYEEGKRAVMGTTVGRRRSEDDSSTESSSPSRNLPPLTPSEVLAFEGEPALVGARLREDFERSGLRLRDTKQRARMEALLGEAAHWPALFSRHLSDASALGMLELEDKRAVDSLPPEWRDELLAASSSSSSRRRPNKLLLPLDGASLARFLSCVPDERAREAAWRAGQASPRANAAVAADMLRGRAEMASLLGAPSYAALKASGGGALAGSPTAVAAFLCSAADQVRPLADAEVERLRRAKAKDTGSPSAVLRAWDVDYYSARDGGGRGAGAAAAAAAPYLKLRSVLEGLGELVLRVFGVRMRLEPLGPGEAWAPGIVRVGLLNEDDGAGGGVVAESGGTSSSPPPWRSPAPPAPGERLATLYLDLCPRPGKTPGSVLFPVRCGRVLDGGDDDDEGGGLLSSSSSASPSYQTPIMVLVMSIGGGGDGGGGGGRGSGAAAAAAAEHDSSSGWLASPTASSSTCSSVPDLTLSWRELRTLVHETGHALHNACSRTRYQHLWGTRCAQDVVEVPSHLFEHFVGDPQAAGVIARHALSRAPLPEALHARLCASLDASFPALELQHQALLALADQACHGGGPAGYELDLGRGGGGPANDAEAVASAVSAAWGALSSRYAPSVPFVEGSRPHLRFAHLATYGAAYYAYPYAKCLAEALWGEFFSSSGKGGGGGGGALDPSAGRALRRRLLEPGGAREPRELLGSLLGARAGSDVGGGFAPDPAAWVRSARLGGGGR